MRKTKTHRNRNLMAICIVAYLLITHFIWYRLNSYQSNLVHGGVLTSARIIDKYYDPGGRYSRGHYIVFQYATPQKNIRSSEKLTVPEWNRTSVGQTIPIRYDPARPNYNKVDTSITNNTTEGAFLYVGVIIMPAIVGLSIAVIAKIYILPRFRKK